jgi:outer membrane lipoprotein SlyB
MTIRNINNYLRYIIRPLGLGLAMVMASCAAPSGPGPAKVRQARRDFDSRSQLKTTNTYTQGIVGGAILGAAAGALIGGYTGGGGFNKQRALHGGLIGGAGGGVLGYKVADEKVKQRAKYLAMEKNLDNALANARSSKDKAIRFRSALREELRTTKANSRERSAMIADARSVVAGLDRDIRIQRDAYEAAKQSRVNSRDAYQLRQEIQSLEGQKRALEADMRKWEPADPDGRRPAGTRL